MELIIIGNGFDLSCGLKSTYRDFFIDRITSNIDFFRILSYKLTSTEAMYRINSHTTARNMTSYLSSKDSTLIDFRVNDLSFRGISFWDLYFFYLTYQSCSSENRPNICDSIINGDINDLYWSSVEEEIKHFIEPKKTISNSSTKTLRNTLNDITLVNFDDLKDISCDKDPFCLYFILLVRYYFMISKKMTYEEIINELTVNDLLKELRSFERNFKKYLCEQLSKNTDYNENARKHIFGLSEGIKNGQTPFILSFNYTLPQAKLINNNGINVHGSISNNEQILFGIDSTEIKHTDRAFIFTKTRRKMIEAKSQFSQKLPSRNTVSDINFFGHSLSTADHAYFKSIFDYYNLYDSELTLNFFYTQFRESNQNSIANDIADNAARLIREYGSTMSNEQDGENLLHRLLLEGRLSIKKLRLPKGRKKQSTNE